MQSLYSYLGSGNDLWSEHQFSSGYTRIEISELSIRQKSLQTEAKSDETRKYSVTHKQVNTQILTEWTETGEVSFPSNADSGRRCLIRIAWVPTHVKERRHDVNANLFYQLVELFDHSAARESCASSFAGFTQLPESATGTRPGFLCSYPKLAMTWSRKGVDGTTNIICMADSPKIQDLRQMLDQPFVHQVSEHELAPLLLGAALCSLEIDRDEDIVKHAVRHIETRTGHHGFNSRIEGPADGDLFHLSAKMSGYRTKVASCIRKLDILTAINDYISTQLDASHNGNHALSRDVAESSQHLRSYVDALKRRTKMQRIDADFIQNRVQTQLDALFHLIAEDNAIASHEVAKDSRLLALAAQRDSSSMKSLAVVTMFFLPGTFVSSLFSMPLFDWGDSNDTTASPSNPWRSRLAVYFVVTGPLTILTFTIWGFWMFYDTMRSRRQNQAAQQQLVNGMQLPETHILSKRWTSVSMGDIAGIHSGG